MMRTSSFTIPIDQHIVWAGLVPIERAGGPGDMIRHVASELSLDEVLARIARECVDLCHVRYARIITLEDDGNFYFQAIHPGDMPMWAACLRKPSIPRFAQIVYRSAVLRESPMVIGRDATMPEAIRRAMLMSATDYLYLLPMRVENEPLGILALGEDSSAANARGRLEDRLRIAALIADQASGAIYRARMRERLEEHQAQTVATLARLMESRDPYIGRHCHAVTNVAVPLAVRLGCQPAEVQIIRFAAMLHDIGKVGINDSILKKTGPLSTHEWDVVRDHPKNGAEILRAHSHLQQVAAVIEAHHEWYDGSGYPYGLRGEDIPLASRILAVADAYSAMVDERPYRKASTIEAAVAELQRCVGTQFDRNVVEMFAAMLRPNGLMGE